MIICICDFWGEKEFLNLTEKSSSPKEKEIDVEKLPSLQSIFKTESKELVKPKPRKRVLKRWLVHVDGVQAFYLIRDLKWFAGFRKSLLENPSLRDCQIVWFQLNPPQKIFIDFKWFSMLSKLLHEKIECDYLMSWLSTLGGGYSALGDQFSRCADIAGKISLKQLTIGLRLGDPFLQSRCKLYFSISLIQTGRLRAAKKLIREEHKFAIKHKEYDGRLVKMCQGIWLKLQYEYGLRLERKYPGKINPYEINLFKNAEIKNSE